MGSLVLWSLILALAGDYRDEEGEVRVLLLLASPGFGYSSLTKVRVTVINPSL